jgi:hypothetical protein
VLRRRKSEDQAEAEVQALLWLCDQAIFFGRPGTTGINLATFASTIHITLSFSINWSFFPFPSWFSLRETISSHAQFSAKSAVAPLWLTFR